MISPQPPLRVKVTGTIYREEEIPAGSQSSLGSGYNYTMEGGGNWSFISSEDVGDEGDQITVTVELKEFTMFNETLQYWEAVEVISPVMYYLWLVLMIIGGAVLIVGVLRKPKVAVMKVKFSQSEAAAPALMFVPEEGKEAEVAQPAAATVTMEKLQCPECSRVFMVRFRNRPFKVTCPHCKTVGKVV